MEINLVAHTVPPTIPRMQAAKNVGVTGAYIDKACDQDIIDYGWNGRNKLIVVNDKWQAFTKKYADKKKK